MCIYLKFLFSGRAVLFMSQPTPTKFTFLKEYEGIFLFFSILLYGWEGPSNISSEEIRLS